MQCEKEKAANALQYDGNRKIGFTLIELLVVIAIIAILAAILFPVFARAREQARKATCLSNEKQLGLAIEQYKQDYDGYYPFSWVWNSQNTWYTVYLAPYIKNTQITICPDDPDPMTVGYSYNILFGYYPGGEHTPTSVAGTQPVYCGHPIPIYDGVNESILDNPSQTIDLTEATTYYWWLQQDDGFSAASAGEASNLASFSPQNSNANMVARFYFPDAAIHSGGINSLYADGHVKWQNLSNLMNYTTYCPIQ